MTQTHTQTGTKSFRRMDESTADQWAVIGTESFKNQGRVADRVLGMLESLGDITDGFAVDQLTHCLQTATRAERAGADDEVVIASLCHDIGKAVSVPNHPRIAAEILKPYVRDDVYSLTPSRRALAIAPARTSASSPITPPRMRTRPATTVVSTTAPAAA